MSNLTLDIGYHSLNHFGEEICGDNVEIAEQGQNSTVVVLADGLGSGVKANILSKLTAKIISTMIAENMPIEECVHTIAATLPVCKEREVAYSTFTILHIIDNQTADIIQFDNPYVVLLRDGLNYPYGMDMKEIDGKKIYTSRIDLQMNDTFISFTDGAVYAGVGETLNFGWQRDNIIDFLEIMYPSVPSAKSLATVLTDKCYNLYNGRPGDDTTAVVVKIRERNSVNLMIGPPLNKNDDAQVCKSFFETKGKHIVCGGTTSNMVSRYLGKPIELNLVYINPEIPPTAKIEGVDITTEGVITINKVLTFAKSFLSNNEHYNDWAYEKDGASLIARALFEEATDIKFYVGKAINAAHQNPNLPINFSIKMRLIEELSECLKKMGKKIEVLYY